MFDLHMLPARHGDALWIEYGDPARPHRILIDGGPRSRSTTGMLKELLTGSGDSAPTLELIVVTHIDADHISGILRLLEDDDLPIETRDLWFNGWDHLPSDLLGAKQAESLTSAITSRGLNWNDDFDGAAVMVPDDGPLPRVRLPGDMSLTLLGPSRTDLAALRPVWKREVEDAGLIPGYGAREPIEQPDVLGDRPLDVVALSEEPFEADHSEANGASIAFIAEHDDRRLLATGDAHAATLESGLQRLADEEGVDRIRVDVVKLPHHGSKYNLSRELLHAVDCDRFLFSTNGAIYRHPDPTTVARILVDRNDPELVFNYRKATTERWDSSRLRRRHGYRTIYPDDTEGQGVLVTI
ncbi:MAG: MBL fold metallo-hydrolase [Actinomycetota bacterium]